TRAIASTADDFRLRTLRAASATAALRVFATGEFLTTLRTVDDGIRHARGDELDRTNRVVVSGDDEVHEIRIAVRIGDGHHRDGELLRLLHRDGLFGRINDEHGGRNRTHVLQAAQIFLEALALTLETRHFFLGQLVVGSIFFHALESAHALEARLDRA